MKKKDGESLFARLFIWPKKFLDSRRDLMKEMEELIEEGTAEGVLNEDEEEMLLSVLAFRKTLVREVMVPRTEMICLDAADGIQGLIRIMKENARTRIPVYEGDMDHIIGFIAARDVVGGVVSASGDADLKDFLRPAFFVPETTNLGTLLGEFKRRRIHMAVAVDEYGGVSGLATLEDVVEEIVGDIPNDSDRDGEDITASGDGFLVDGRAEIEKLEEKMGLELASNGDYETIGGLVLKVLGRIPKPGETIYFQGLEIAVRDADKRRVKEVMIRKIIPKASVGGEKN